MTAAPWPCSTCGAAGLRNIAALGFCPMHLCELYRSLSPEVWDGRGIGLLDGRRRPDYGPEYAELRCSLCSATWAGPVFDACPWCADRLDAQRRHQVEVLLHPELPEVADARHDGAVRAWGERLARGVEAELLTEQQARAAWRREVGHVAA